MAEIDRALNSPECSPLNRCPAPFHRLDRYWRGVESYKGMRQKCLQVDQKSQDAMHVKNGWSFICKVALTVLITSPQIPLKWGELVFCKEVRSGHVTWLLQEALQDEPAFKRLNLEMLVLPFQRAKTRRRSSWNEELGWKSILKSNLGVVYLFQILLKAGPLFKCL